MRRVLPIILLGVLGLGFLIDAGARELTEESVAEALETSLSLGDTPRVEISGWSFLVRALQGEFPSVTLSGGATNPQGFRLVDLRAELRDVEYSLGDDVARVQSGTGRAEITAESLNKELARAGLEARAVVKDGSALLTSPQLGETVEVEISVSGRRFVVTPQVGETITLLLPELSEGVSYSSLSVVGSQIVLELTIDHAEFEATG
jgi:hypothetical protein